MPSLLSILWRHYYHLLCRHYRLYYGVATTVLIPLLSSTMPSLLSIIWRRYHIANSSIIIYYAVITVYIMAPLPSILWHHYRLYYGIITVYIMASSPSILWHHYRLYYGIITVYIMASSPSILWRRYLIKTPLRCY